MKQFGRLRRVLKWSGTVASLLVAAAFGASIWRNIWWISADWQHEVELRYGAVWYCSPSTWSAASHRPGEPGPGWTVWKYAGRWRVHWLDLGGHRPIILPLWIPFVVLALPTAFLWWRDRRRTPPGHCQTCGYNLTGNVSGICPECGTPVPQRADARPGGAGPGASTGQNTDRQLS